ncbi:lysophospholipid acyltransferase family protein [Sulfurovum sp. NBC37-1]|uniref:lysophospholipid acyltransferase family protein n=1 Tax=Sulfurovum sp. (strain NBC37-1) TaxID=387093 RepID=UPI0001587A31|nr:lysophospholipid acyltransferase family protein [Sulfurovum sp. NBC37-1]BAF72416.1 1-acyl-sn-glycerol-3-phosphate acyltransferase [Sulfurovum sp. NBC37-1]
MKIFAKIRFGWNAFVIAVNTGLIMIPAIILFPKYKGPIMHHLNRLTLFLMGAKAAQEGEMDPEADMIVMNHQGIVDIIGMEALQNNHLRWVAKKELFSMPLYGYLLRFGDMISLDRSSKAGLIKLMKDVKESIEEKHRAVAIFPEGTRAKDQKVLPFKQGTKMIAEKLKLKVQPVVITGSKRVVNEHEKTGHGGTIHYKFLPTIDVGKEDKEWFDRIHDQMQKEIDNEFTNHHRSR